jgi:hypothetical protein
VVREGFRSYQSIQGQVGDAFAAGIVLYTGETFTPMGADCYAMPLDMLLKR